MQVESEQIRAAIAQRAAYVEFDAEEHLYWLGERCLPSVTTVLEYSGFTNHKFADVAARDRGSRVHKAIADMERYGLTVDEAAEDLPEEERGYLRCYGTFKEQTGIRVVASEQRVYGEIPSASVGIMQFAGTADLVGLIGDQLVIVDFKTSKSLDKHVGLQLAGYQIAMIAPYAVRLGLRLDPSGEYTNKNLREFTSVSDADYFGAALMVMYGRRGKNFYKPMERKMRAIDISGDVASVTFTYNEDDVALMRDLELARYWNKQAKAYLVPFDVLDNVLPCLERAGFEVK